MPEGIDKETLLMIALIGGLPGAAVYVMYKAAEYLGPRITSDELLPLTPLEGLPLPRFVKAKPEVLQGLLKQVKIVEEATT